MLSERDRVEVSGELTLQRFLDLPSDGVVQKEVKDRTFLILLLV